MLKIKSSHKDTVIAFNNSGIPLGKRSQADLLDLAIMAQESGHKSLLDAFEDTLPTIEELRKKKMASIEKATKTKAPVTEAANNVNTQEENK